MHRPGAIPLRPLTVGDIYDGAIRIMRTNPGATIGAALLVAAVTGLIPFLVSVFVGLTYGAVEGFNPFDPDAVLNRAEPTTAQMLGSSINFGGQMLGAVLQSFGLLIVTGMVVHVVSAAVLGRTMSLGEAWAATRGRRWRLIRLVMFFFAVYALVFALIIAVFFVLLFAIDPTSGAFAGIALAAALMFLLLVPLLAWSWIRFYLLPVPILMLEDVGVIASIRRGYRLTAGSFWRTFGIALLTVILSAVAGSLITFPLGAINAALLFGVGGAAGLIASSAITAVSSIVSAAFLTPFTAAVTCLQYVDLRMRKEALDVQLMTATGAGPGPAGPGSTG
ncbi:MAG: hypothetical protein WAW88_06865 [Nocardioides sp.]